MMGYPSMLTMIRSGRPKKQSFIRRVLVKLRILSNNDLWRKKICSNIEQ
jgi:hypothetical protein